MKSLKLALIFLVFTSCTTQLKIEETKGIPVLYKVPAVKHTVVIDFPSYKLELYEDSKLIFRQDGLSLPIAKERSQLSSIVAPGIYFKPESILPKDRNSLTNVTLFLNSNDQEANKLVSSAISYTSIYSKKEYTINPRLPWFGKNTFEVTLNDDGTLKTLSSDAEGGGTAAVEALTSVAGDIFGFEGKIAEESEQLFPAAGTVKVVVTQTGQRATYTRTIPYHNFNGIFFPVPNGGTLGESQLLLLPASPSPETLKMLHQYYSVTFSPLQANGNPVPTATKSENLEIKRTTTWSIPKEGVDAVKGIMAPATGG